MQKMGKCVSSAAAPVQLAMQNASTISIIGNIAECM